MNATRIRRKVRERVITNEFNQIKYVELTTYCNDDIVVIIDPNRPDSVDITKRPARMSDEQSRCLVALLQHGHRMFEGNKLKDHY
jgi:hypothetical protein